MMAWATEQAALEHMIEKFGSGTYACVMDSYDYEHALSAILPAVASRKLAKGGYLVLRPDSGDAVATVVAGLRAAEAVFGCDLNTKGFKVPRGCSVIQGDSIDCKSLVTILEAVQAAGFSAQAVGFGMGGGLLQKVNRDTLSFATKLSNIQYAGGHARDVMKAPLTDLNKVSLPGVMQVRREGGVPTAYCVPEAGRGAPLVAPEEDLLRVVYDRRPVTGVWDDFDTVRERVRREWEALPPRADPLSSQLKGVIAQIAPEHARALRDKADRML